MKTKYITTTYTSGYTLAPGYRTIEIETPGTIEGGLTLTGGHAVKIVDFGKVVGAYGGTEEAGGAGLTLAGTARLSGKGSIVGGRGHYAVGYYGGGAGGSGVSLASGSSLVTAGTIAGGAGGAGGEDGNRGGDGGTGASLASGSSLTTKGTITGGAGGDTGDEGEGGAGGAGVSVASGTSLTNTGFIAAGAGGNTGDGGQGGAGGAGVSVASGASLTNTGFIAGGAGGVSDFRDGYGGTGVTLAAGSSLTNKGSIIGGGRGGVGVALASGSSLTMTGGVIEGGYGDYGRGSGGAGVYLGEGSSLTMTAGSIVGGSGGYGGKRAGFDHAGSGAPAVVALVSLTLAGTITGGPGGNAVYFGGDGAAGVLADADLTTAATIVGGAGGEAFSHYSGDGGDGGVGVVVEEGALTTTVGTITGGAGGLGSGANGADGNGVDLNVGTVINGDATHSTALVKGLIGIQVNGVGTVTNFATIQGGTSVEFTDPGDHLIAEAGSVFIGAVTGGGGTLELAGGTGTITGLGKTGTVTGAAAMTFSGFGSYDFDAGASWTLAGTSVLARGQTLANAGTLIGTLGLGAASDRVILETGGVFSGLVNGGGGTLELAGGTGTITGLGSKGVLSGAEAMTFSGFGAYDVDAGSSWTLAGANILAAGKTLANAGTLTGTFGLGAASARVILESGGVFSGAVNGGGGTLELAGGGGTIAGLGSTGMVSGAEAMTFSGFGSYVIDAGSSWTLAGTDILAAGQTLSNAGNLTGTLSLGALSARVILRAGGVISGPVNGGGGTLELNGLSGTISGLGSTGTVSGGQAMTFSGFGAYDLNAVAGSWTLAGTDVLAAARTLTNAGTLTVLGSLTNAGAIVGTLGLGGPTARLVAEAGSSITGLARGNGGTLELAGGSGTISGLGATGTVSGGVAMTFRGFGSYGFDAGSAFTLTGGNTAAGSLTNAGSLTIAAGASLTVQGAVTNSGVMIDDGDLTLKRAVTGTGTMVISAGTLDAASSFAQNVTFVTAGELELAHSTAYTGSITGFSRTGATSLDLRDVGFVASTEATFSGTTAGGVLTVSDGTHTAEITLVGDYTTAAFFASGDGDGGTVVVASATPQAPVSSHPFVAAMAGLGGSASEALHFGQPPPSHAAAVMAPRTQLA